MLIDGQIIAINDTQYDLARQQMGLPSGYTLVQATGLLIHDTGNGLVQIRLPAGLVVGEFENLDGHRCYGVVSLIGLESIEQFSR
ncbi:hypothetical protein [Pseudomonas sp. Fl4BN1]|uniref:hypothetical protein n=1 Tax=Pseudomonas sp. Fl4BN1 TaxID=2697651 RepID=UPI001377F2A2|nr:hypothetical protein [Pseudomonas sp. Fl4BN1]NBF12902.1 hypothetical protein [Pseudomonas sp. Fl4BN1]